MAAGSALSAAAGRPRSPRLHLAGLVARLPLSMTGLGIVLLVSIEHRLLRAGRPGRGRRHGDRRRRGAGWGRQIDRIGQARVLLAAAMICIAQHRRC